MFDAPLAIGPFGQATVITARAAAWYTAQGIPAAVACTGRIHPYLDYVAAQRFQTGADLPLPAAAVHDVPRGPVEDCVNNNNHPYDDLLTGEVTRRLTEHHMRLDTDTDSLRTCLRAADRTLRQTIPTLWEQIHPLLCRARLVDDDTLAGMSWDDLSGLILLGRTKTADPRPAAETVLHEALHTKAARLTRSFDEPFPPTSPEFIEIPWWRTADRRRLWGTRRVFDAYYVYAHLSTYYACRRHILGQPEETLALQRTSFRAAYLLNILKQLPDVWLDHQRRALVEWLAHNTPDPTGLSDLGRRLLATDIHSFNDADAALDPAAALTE